ncbi:hypothetical protein [Neorhizobium galegae]|uniref:hypothetical protein n=1 Tax=Neorhizobium galegae TaxID=399 RepID=UPI000A577F84|nr:hypothetical protein [Neorhizobium galegae]
MNPKNDDACSDDLPNGDGYPELTDDELEKFVPVLIEALTFPSLPIGWKPGDGG